MIRFRNYLPAVALLVGAAILGVPTQARATMIFITLSEAGFTSVTSPAQTGVTNSFGPTTIGQYTVTVNTNDSAPGTNILGQAIITQNTISVAATTTPTAALVITVQDATYNPIGSPVALTNSLSTTLITAGTVSAIGYVGTPATATSSVSLSGPTITGAVASSATIAAAPGPLTLGNVATVTGLAVGAANGDNFTVTTLATATPEPASVVTFLTALPVLGLSYWRRRRQVRSQATA